MRCEAKPISRYYNLLRTASQRPCSMLCCYSPLLRCKGTATYHSTQSLTSLQKLGKKRVLFKVHYSILQCSLGLHLILYLDGYIVRLMYIYTEIYIYIYIYIYIHIYIEYNIKKAGCRACCPSNMDKSSTGILAFARAPFKGSLGLLYRRFGVDIDWASLSVGVLKSPTVLALYPGAPNGPK